MLKSQLKMERQKPKTPTAEKLLAILERNAKGVPLEEREKKWEALEKALRQKTPVTTALAPRLKCQFQFLVAQSVGPHSF